jgi:asparagine synthase (glutamine-hydrolysing)
MAERIAHRGPDDHGHWWDAATGVGLAHRRLSILDLTAEGHQPMHSPGGRYVISFNGEVYNFAEIRRELELGGLLARPLRGHSDTEIMLAAFDAWGLERAIPRFVGMFAFALWDRKDRAIHLVRDRLGVKPLYYGSAGGRLVFASELAALTAAAGFERDLDQGAVASYLRLGYVPAPRSIYRAAKKVRPASIVTFRSASPESGTETHYWSAVDVAARGQRDAFDGSDAEATTELERRLREAVRLRLVSDVPLGAFLSGGIDSSVVVAMMQSESARPVKTFSIGNTDAAYDEGASAAAVARHLGTDHTAVTITPEDALDLVPALPRIYDEPFADSSQLPTYLVSRIARKDVTVALSGDGGDEVFGGYNRHLWGPRLWGAMRPLPLPVRKGLQRALLALSTEQWDRLHGLLGPAAPAVRLAGHKAHKIARLLGARSPEDLYRLLCSAGDASVILRPGSGVDVETPDAGLATLGESMMLWDLVGYLPDDIMTKVDRASMAVSLEAREPLLDHRLVEFAWQLPLHLKIRGGTGKWILRQVLYRHVPRELVDRPKMGFSIPLGEWLRGPLRGWATDLLDAKRVAEGGLLDGKVIDRLWREHQSGARDHGEQLWSILVLQAWLGGAG